MSKVVCSNPAAIDLKQVVTAPLWNARQQVLVSLVLGYNHHKRLCLCHNMCGTLKNPHCSVQVYVKICSLSPVMVTSPHEWKNLVWDKTKTNKTVVQDEYNHFFDYISINPPRDVVVSVAWHSYSRSVRLGGFKYMKAFNGNVTSRSFEIFRIEIRAKPSTILSSQIFPDYIDIHKAQGWNNNVLTCVNI